MDTITSDIKENIKYLNIIRKEKINIEQIKLEKVNLQKQDLI